jgi:hypothetical protein
MKEWQPSIDSVYRGPLVLQCDKIKCLHQNALSMCGDVHIIDCPLLETIESQSGVGKERRRKSRLKLENLPSLVSLSGSMYVREVRLYNVPRLRHIPVFSSAVCIKLGEMDALESIAVMHTLQRLRLSKCSSITVLESQPILQKLDLFSCTKLTTVHQAMAAHHSKVVKNVVNPGVLTYLETHRWYIWCNIQIENCRCITSAGFEPLDVAVFMPGSVFAHKWSLFDPIPREAWEYSIPWLHPSEQRMRIVVWMQRRVRRRRRAKK